MKRRRRSNPSALFYEDSIYKHSFRAAGPFLLRDGSVRVLCKFFYGQPILLCLVAAIRVGDGNGKRTAVKQRKRPSAGSRKVFPFISRAPDRVWNIKSIINLLFIWRCNLASESRAVIPPAEPPFPPKVSAPDVQSYVCPGSGPHPVRPAPASH